MNFHGHHVESIYQHARRNGGGEWRVAVIRRGGRSEREVVDVASSRHVAPENLHAVDVDNAAVIAEQPKREARKLVRVTDDKAPAKVSRDERRTIGHGMDYGRFTAIAKAQLRKPRSPGAVVIAEPAPGRSGVNTRIEIAPVG